MIKFFGEFLGGLNLMVKKGRKFGAILSLFALIFSLFSGSFISKVLAASAGSVVINEVAWAGSMDSGNDEWIELYNATDSAINLENWSIKDDNGDSLYKIFSGTIEPHGYFLIEDHEASISNLTSDMVVSLSLANTGDTLQLLDENGILIDEVNASGAMWPAGNNTTRASMERKDALVSGNVDTNWMSSVGGSGAKGSGNSVMLGTPKVKNSNGEPAVVASSAEVSLVAGAAKIKAGDLLDVNIHIKDVKQIFSYGFELSYDPMILHFKEATSLGFLGDKTVSSFQAGLQNGIEGNLLLAETRLDKANGGVDGTADVVKVQFMVAKGADTQVQFLKSSFLANAAADLGAKFVGVELIGAPSEVMNVSNLIAKPGEDRYSVALHFDAVDEADGYRVYRKDAHAKFVLLGEIKGSDYVDAKSLVPGLEYSYEVRTVLGELESSGVGVSVVDGRGLKGDNDRSDRVDGRDLENLAKHFGETDDLQNFEVLVDTTGDGRIDGSDLIDLGINFAKTFSV